MNITSSFSSINKLIVSTPNASYTVRTFHTSQKFSLLFLSDYLYLTATTQIVEGTMVYAYKGETLNLTCIINHNYDRRPSHVIWYHQNDVRNKQTIQPKYLPCALLNNVITSFYRSLHMNRYENGTNLP